MPTITSAMIRQPRNRDLGPLREAGHLLHDQQTPDRSSTANGMIPMERKVKCGRDLPKLGGIRQETNHRVAEDTETRHTEKTRSKIELSQPYNLSNCLLCGLPLCPL